MLSARSLKALSEGLEDLLSKVDREELVGFVEAVRSGIRMDAIETEKVLQSFVNRQVRAGAP